MKKNQNAKKILTYLLLLLFLLSFFLGSCNPSEETRTQYFKNFASTPAYTKITEKLRLEKGVTIAQYDDTSSFFITQKNYLDDAEDVRFGFCSATKELIYPRFTQVLDIRGNFALVTLTFGVGDIIKNRIGIVKIQGEGSNNINNYGFSYTYIPTITQYTMLNENYVVVMGDKNSQETEYDEAVIYDYSSTDGLLEVARVDDIKNSTKFYFAEDYLIAQSPGIARVYNITDIDKNGYLKIKSYYSPFYESEGYDLSYVEVNPYYLGNNWFIFSAFYSSTEEYDDYEIIKTVEDKGETKEYYMSIKSTRFNASTGFYYDTDRVSLVANKYTSLLVKDIANIMNISNSEIYINVEEGETDYLQKVYSPPVFPTSEIIRDGYSIVYSYFPVYSSESTYTFQDTFQIYDSNANRISIPEAVMPILYVNERGLQNIDPNFSLPQRDIGYHGYKDYERTSLKAMSEIVAYDPYMIHSDIIIAMEFNLAKPITNYSAAFNFDGKQLTPFDYDVFTPYFGEYAIAGKIEEVDSLDFFKYYRIDKAGNISPIDKFVFSVHNGVYVVKETANFSLYANNGKKLLSADSTSISVVDRFFVDGYVFKSFVVTIEDGAGVIYELE